jgi:membrane protease YdiL (CAAX protease family)
MGVNKMSIYKYRPVRFYLITFAGTWGFWFSAAFISRMENGSSISFLLMAFGLLVPPVTALLTVFTSKSKALKRDLLEKLIGSFRVKPVVVLVSVVLFFAVIAVSILLSTFFGQSLDQFAFVDDFSFAIGGMSTLLLLILVAFLEELGWRGYAEDAIASYMSWWKESLLFGVVWSLWHLPLFFIPDTYQNNILQLNPWYMVNFFISILPLSFIFTWIYVKNNRSILACMFFHLTVNFLQERVAMTDTTKCVQTFVLFVTAIVLVLLNKELYFGTKHIGNILGENINTNIEENVDKETL